MGNAKLDKAKGRVKKAAGELTGNSRLKREGTVQKAKGTMKQKAGTAKAKAKRAVGR